MIGSREKGLIIALGIIVYAFLFYKFNYISAMPEIEAIQNNIKIKTNELQKLERDKENIYQKRTTRESLDAQNERIEVYLMKNADMTDSMVFIDTFSRIFKKELASVSIVEPEEVVDEGIKYYEFGINFNMTASIGELKEMMSYIEGGTKKAKITKMNITPFVEVIDTIVLPESDLEEYEEKNPPSISNNDEIYAITMGISFYSVNKGIPDKLLNYSRHKFDDFSIKDEIGQSSEANVNFSKGGYVINNTPVHSSPTLKKKKDIEIEMENYLAGGYNFRFIGINKYLETIKLKTKERVSINLEFEGLYYSVEISDKDHRVIKVSGRTPSDDINILINTFVPDFHFNENYMSDIKVTNKTDKKIIFSTLGKGTRSRFVVRDRSGNLISKQSSSEKIYIFY